MPAATPGRCCGIGWSRRATLQMRASFHHPSPCNILLNALSFPEWLLPRTNLKSSTAGASSLWASPLELWSLKRSLLVFEMNLFGLFCLQFFFLFMVVYFFNMSSDLALPSGEELLKLVQDLQVPWTRGDTVPCTLWFFIFRFQGQTFTSLPSRVSEVSRQRSLGPSPIVFLFKKRLQRVG